MAKKKATRTVGGYKLTRKFNGLGYALYGSRQTKTRAKQLAQSLRDGGGLARVITVNRNLHLIYFRKTTRKRRKRKKK